MDFGNFPFMAGTSIVKHLASTIKFPLFITFHTIHVLFINEVLLNQPLL